MLSLTRDLIKKTQEADPSGSAVKIKPLTVCFWSDFMANPSIMYELFTPNSRKLDYDPDKVKVMGTKDGMIRYVSSRVLVTYTTSAQFTHVVSCCRYNTVQIPRHNATIWIHRIIEIIG